MNIHLHIERLVLDTPDSDVGRDEALRVAVAQELTQLLREGRLGSRFASGGRIDQIRGKTLERQKQAGADAFGRRVATALYGTLVELQ
jgi:hypothetical protein